MYFHFDPSQCLRYRQGEILLADLHTTAACPLTTTLCFLPGNESLPLEDSARLGLEASSKLAVLDLRLLTDTTIGTDDGVFNPRTELRRSTDNLATLI